MRLKRDEYANKLTNLKVEIASVSSEILSLEGDIERIKFALSNNQSIREELNKSITENNVQFLYQLATPIETPLTADQIEAYKSLHTNESNTTISNDQNAWMEVKYISK